MVEKDIILVGINSRYTHTSLGLRYLFANLKELQDKAKILEFVINEDIQSIAENILKHKPKIVSIGVYIWNISDVSNLIDILKKIEPDLTIIIGGPEASHTPHRVDLSKADYIIKGEGEVSYYELCRDLFLDKPPRERIIVGKLPDLKNIKLPYRHYNKHDIEYRYTYVEASRGCPFECEFCLSAIDERVRSFDMDRLLEEFDELWSRGARSFKFIDRTFNINIKSANRLMDFFLSKDEPFSLHFEVIPDSFPKALRERIAKFPPASLQLEIGIQTLNPKILDNINRRMDLDKVKENISYLENETHAHLHLDLIVGLPGESIESFANNLDSLVSMTSSEIQIGILKKLSGTTLDRHDSIYGMIYNDKPPYDILKNNQIDFFMMQRMKRFARFWDIAYNSGNFKQSVQFLWEDGKIFDGFFGFSEWIYSQTLSTYQISLNRFSELLFNYLTSVLGYDTALIADSIVADIISVKGRKIPGYLREYATFIPDLRDKKLTKHNKRQILRMEDN